MHIFRNVTLVDHPLAAVELTTLRNRATPSGRGAAFGQASDRWPRFWLSRRPGQCMSAKFRSKRLFARLSAMKWVRR